MRRCRNGCGRFSFGAHETCCTHCKGADGPHARDCAAKSDGVGKSEDAVRKHKSSLNAEAAPTSLRTKSASPAPSLRPKARGSTSVASPYLGATPTVADETRSKKKSITSPRPPVAIGEGLDEVRQKKSLTSPRSSTGIGEVRQEKSLSSPRPSAAVGEVRQKKKSLVGARPSSAASDASHASPASRGVAAPITTSPKSKPKPRPTPTRKRISQITVTEIIEDDFDAGIEVSGGLSNSEDETIACMRDSGPSVSKEKARREVEHKAKCEAEEISKREAEARTVAKDKIFNEADDAWKEDPMIKANLLAAAKEEAEAEEEARQAALREEENRKAAVAHYATCQGHAPIGGHAVTSSPSAYLSELKETFPDAPEALLQRAARAQSIDEAMDIMMAEL